MPRRRFSRSGRSPAPNGADVEGTAWAEGRAPGKAAPHLHLVDGDVYPSWEAIYRDNVNRVYGLMFAKSGNRPDAEDLTAQVFLAALRPLRTSASVGEVRAYLLATARTVLASHWRRTLGREITTVDIEQAADLFASPPVTSDAPQRAEAILAALPDRYRRILQLRFLDAYSIREAAAELQVTISNAKVLQHRALQRAAEVAARMDE